MAGDFAGPSRAGLCTDAHGSAMQEQLAESTCGAPKEGLSESRKIIGHGQTSNSHSALSAFNFANSASSSATLLSVW